MKCSACGFEAVVPFVHCQRCGSPAWTSERAQEGEPNATPPGSPAREPAPDAPPAGEPALRPIDGARSVPDAAFYAGAAAKPTLPADDFFGGASSQKATLPNDAFFGDGATGAASGNMSNDAFFGGARPHASHIQNEAFFADDAPPPPPPTNVLDLPRRPWAFAGVMAGIGLATIILNGADFMQQLVLVAPIFEEALKFGVALTFILLLGARSTLLRVLIGLVPGALFGIGEHYLAYSAEPALIFGGRIVFHSGASALSVATWSAIEKLPEVRLQWLATLPATILHAANNALAIVTAMVSLFTEETGAGVFFLLGIHAAIAFTAHAAAWTFVGMPTLVQRLARAVGRTMRLT